MASGTTEAVKILVLGSKLVWVFQLLKLTIAGADVVQFGSDHSYDVAFLPELLSFDVIICPYRWYLLDLALARRRAKHKPFLVLQTAAVECINHLVDGGICEQVNPRNLVEQFRPDRRSAFAGRLAHLQGQSIIRISRRAFTECAAYSYGMRTGGHRITPQWLESSPEQAYAKAKEVYATMLLEAVRDRGNMVVKPIFKPVGPRESQSEGTKRAFMLMPFDAELTRLYADVIRATVEECGIQIARADDFFETGSIVEQIWTSINNSDFLIADLTGRNPNVFYELGIAHTLGKPVILLTQRIEDVPFDLKHQRVIQYSVSFHEIPKLRQDLKSTIEQLRLAPRGLQLLDDLDETLGGWE